MEEIDNVENWTIVNNLILTVRWDGHPRQQEKAPAGDLPLGVTINCNLSVYDHVNNIVRSSAQTVHSLWLLRAYGMADSSIHMVQAFVVDKLTYAHFAASAWWGFTSSADHQRLEAVLPVLKRSEMIRP